MGKCLEIPSLRCRLAFVRRRYRSDILKFDCAQDDAESEASPNCSVMTRLGVRVSVTIKTSGILTEDYDILYALSVDETREK